MHPANCISYPTFVFFRSSLKKKCFPYIIQLLSPYITGSKRGKKEKQREVCLCRHHLSIRNISLSPSLSLGNKRRLSWTALEWNLLTPGDGERRHGIITHSNPARVRSFPPLFQWKRRQVFVSTKNTLAASTARNPDFSSIATKSLCLYCILHEVESVTHAINPYD